MNYPYEGPAALAGPVEAALQRVIDPELALDIVSLGLVAGVRVAERSVQVDLTTTSAACPAGDLILDDVEFELEQSLPEGFTVQPRLVDQPEWTPERMTDSARSSMGW